MVNCAVCVPKLAIDVGQSAANMIMTIVGVVQPPAVTVPFPAVRWPQQWHSGGAGQRKDVGQSHPEWQYHLYD